MNSSNIFIAKVLNFIIFFAFGLLLVVSNVFIPLNLIIFAGILTVILNILTFTILIPYRNRINILEVNRNLEKNFVFKTNNYFNRLEIFLVISIISIFLSSGIITYSFIGNNYVKLILFVLIIYFLTNSITALLRLIKFKNTNEKYLYEQ